MPAIENNIVDPDKTTFKTTITKIISAFLSVVAFVAVVSYGISSTYGTITNNQSILFEKEQSIEKKLDLKVDKSDFDKHIDNDRYKDSTERSHINEKLDNIIDYFNIPKTNLSKKSERGIK